MRRREGGRKGKRMSEYICPASGQYCEIMTQQLVKYSEYLTHLAKRQSDVVIINGPDYKACYSLKCYLASEAKKKINERSK